MTSLYDQLLRDYPMPPVDVEWTATDLTLRSQAERFFGDSDSWNEVEFVGVHVFGTCWNCGGDGCDSLSSDGEPQHSECVEAVLEAQAQP